VTLDSVGGLGRVKEALRETVVLPFTRPELYGTGASSVSGILLYGPPGTGKTLCARAVATECRSTFLAVDASMLKDKYMGESEKLVAALFSLAAKLSPTVIFFDEIDALLGSRTMMDQASTVSVKTGIMSAWDGISSVGSAKVLVIGATNRPRDLDTAVLRRLPRQFHVPRPTTAERADILKILLGGEGSEVDVAAVAAATPGFTGSDLKQLLGVARLRVVREFVDAESAGTAPVDGVRCLRTGDLLLAVADITPVPEPPHQ
jgi:SpoVK/Ycf46/Vps4 family AAA+-type ATPase